MSPTWLRMHGLRTAAGGLGGPCSGPPESADGHARWILSTSATYVHHFANALFSQVLFSNLSAPLRDCRRRAMDDPSSCACCWLAPRAEWAHGLPPHSGGGGRPLCGPLQGA